MVDATLHLEGVGNHEDIPKVINTLNEAVRRGKGKSRKLLPLIHYITENQNGSDLGSMLSRALDQ